MHIMNHCDDRHKGLWKGIFQEGWQGTSKFGALFAPLARDDERLSFSLQELFLCEFPQLAGFVPLNYATIRGASKERLFKGCA